MIGETADVLQKPMRDPPLPVARAALSVWSRRECTRAKSQDIQQDGDCYAGPSKCPARNGQANPSARLSGMVCPALFVTTAADGRADPRPAHSACAGARVSDPTEVTCHRGGARGASSLRYFS